MGGYAPSVAIRSVRDQFGSSIERRRVQLAAVACWSLACLQQVQVARAHPDLDHSGTAESIPFFLVFTGLTVAITAPLFFSTREEDRLQYALCGVVLGLSIAIVGGMQIV